MRDARHSGRAIVVSLALGLACAVDGAVASGAGGSPSKESPRGEEKAVPRSPQEHVRLACRVLPFTEGERMARMARGTPFERGWVKLTPRLCNNPMLAGHSYGRVEIRNASGREVAVYPDDGQEFWVTARVEDAAGRPVSFDRRERHSVARLTKLLPDPNRNVATLKPAQVANEVLDVIGLCPPDTDVKPGKYTVRAVCHYYRVPDGVECTFESEPFSFTITAEDLGQWRAFEEAWDKARRSHR